MLAKKKVRQATTQTNVFLNKNTQTKYDQLQVGDFLVVKNNLGQKLISDWKVTTINEYSISLTSINSVGSSMEYTNSEIEGLDFCRIIQ